MYDTLQMGDPKKEVTEEDRDAAQVAKGKAMEALGESELLGWIGGSLDTMCHTSHPICDVTGILHSTLNCSFCCDVTSRFHPYFSPSNLLCPAIAVFIRPCSVACNMDHHITCDTTNALTLML